MDLRRAERPLRGDRLLVGTTGECTQTKPVQRERHAVGISLRCPQTFQKGDSHLVAARDFGRL
jgi:hypothetical protein